MKLENIRLMGSRVANDIFLFVCKYPGSPIKKIAEGLNKSQGEIGSKIKRMENAKIIFSEYTEAEKSGIYKRIYPSARIILDHLYKKNRAEVYDKLLLKKGHFHKAESIPQFIFIVSNITKSWDKFL